MTRLQRYLSVIVHTRFEGFHCWPMAPEPVEFLRHMHRHEFHVELIMRVTHAERDIEFIQVKNALEGFIHGNPFEDTASCETMAGQIIDWAVEKYGERGIICCVFEDGENGAMVEES